MTGWLGCMVAVFHSWPALLVLPCLSPATYGIGSNRIGMVYVIWELGRGTLD